MVVVQDFPHQPVRHDSAALIEHDQAIDEVHPGAEDVLDDDEGEAA